MKYNPKAQIFFLLLLIWSAVIAVGQPRLDATRSSVVHPWSLAEFALEAGLQDQYVMDLTWGQDGSLWVAAASGLYRFDGQSWRRFGAGDGLPSDFVRTVRADREGTIWVGTDRGIARGEGDSFHPLEQQPEALNIRRIREARDGSLYFAADSWLRPEVPGGLSRLRNGELTSVPVPDPYVLDIFPSDSLTILLAESGPYRSTSSGWVGMERPEGSGQPRHIAGNEQDIILATSSDVLVLRNGRWVDAGGGLPSTRYVGAFSASEGEIYALEPSTGTLYRWGPGTWEFEAETGLGQHIPEAILERPGDGVWVAGIGVVARFGPSADWMRHPGPPGQLVYDERGDVLWLQGTQGTFRRTPTGAWKQIAPRSMGVFPVSGGVTWIWRQRQILQVDDSGTPSSFSAAELGLPDGVLGFAASDSLAVGLGFVNESIHVSVLENGRWRLIDTGLDGWSDLTIDGDRVWVAGRGGRTRPIPVVAVRDGQLTRTLSPPVTSLEGLRFLGRESPPLVSGEFGIARLENSFWIQASDLPFRDVLGWYSTDRGDWIANSGLFGSISGISFRDDQTLRTQPVSPLRVLQPHAIYRSSTHLLMVDTTASGVVLQAPLPSSSVRSAVRTRNGDFWVSDDEGLWHMPYLENPPETSVTLSTRRVAPGSQLVAFITSRTPWQPARGEARQASWRLNDGSWSPFSAGPHVTIDASMLPRGEHVVEIRTRDMFGLADPTPVREAFRVVPHAVQERRWFWPTVLSVILLLMVTSALALRSRRTTRQLNRDLENKVQRRTSELEAVSLELQRVQELERRRLAQDLHDDVGGSLTTLKMALMLDIQRLAAPTDDALKARVDIVQELMDRVRTVSLMLRPAALDDFGLSAAVRTLINRLDEHSDVRMELHDHLDASLDLSGDAQTAAYRIVQESLMNVARHANATRVRIDLHCHEDALYVKITDNGQGIEAKLLSHPTPSSGLQGMRRRAEVVGGSLEVNTSAEGTEVTFCLPLTGRKAAE